MEIKGHVTDLRKSIHVPNFHFYHSRVGGNPGKAILSSID